jgi:hypothetical protein
VALLHLLLLLVVVALLLGLLMFFFLLLLQLLVFLVLLGGQLVLLLLILLVGRGVSRVGRRGLVGFDVARMRWVWSRLAATSRIGGRGLVLATCFAGCDGAALKVTRTRSGRDRRFAVVGRGDRRGARSRKSALARFPEPRRRLVRRCS